MLCVVAAFIVTRRSDGTLINEVKVGSCYYSAVVYAYGIPQDVANKLWPHPGTNQLQPHATLATALMNGCIKAAHECPISGVDKHPPPMFSLTGLDLHGRPGPYNVTSSGSPEPLCQAASHTFAFNPSYVAGLLTVARMSDHDNAKRAAWQAVNKLLQGLEYVF